MIKRGVRWTSRFLDGSRGDFIRNLSIVTLCFVLSKIFSSVSSIAYTRYLGRTILGETRVLSLVAQLVAVPMMFGLHASMMKYGTNEDNPAPEVATVTYLFGIISIFTATLVWFGRSWFQDWLSISDYKLAWAMLSAFLVAAYQVLMSILQTLHRFKMRGLMEILMAFLLLPGMLLAHVLVGRHYENQLIALALSYAIPMAIIVVRFRHLLAPRWFGSDHTRAILKYGLIMAISNIAFIIVFVVQPLQVRRILDDDGLGLFYVYSIGSLNLATLATGIFFSVFFPKVARSSNRHAVWQTLSRAWTKAIAPLFAFFCLATCATLFLSGRHQYPLQISSVLWFALASALITLHSTYSQILIAEGLRGVIWNLALSFISAGINYWLTQLLVSEYGVNGAPITLAINYGFMCIATWIVGHYVVVKRGLAANLPASAS